MKRPSNLALAVSGEDVASRRTIAATSVPPARSPLSPPREALRQRKYQELIRKHLDPHLDKLFAGFTGLHFHIAWAPLPPHAWDEHAFPTGCSVCCRLSGSPLLADCRICGPEQLARALNTDGDGHHFTCRLGVRNYWFRIHVRGATLGIAYLQALDRRPPPKTMQIHRAAEVRSARRKPAKKTNHRQSRDARYLSWAEFNQTAQFLRLIVEHVQTASLSDLRKADLTSAGRAVAALEKEQAQLHEALQRHLPAPPPVGCRSGTETHTEQVVQRLLNCISQNYAEPITLQRCAARLGMNAAYLSALFSRALGKPFKTYLTERRVEKAKALLSDPAKTASEVAHAVGYASADRFRVAFKHATGLPPRIWRATMQSPPPP